ncbi:hypothetical protein E1A91_D05G356600v1 [Gossypium mustelinum]|uniref:Uncharacterized protein n=1 Tax=Gossypium mustelinum TaxID=34275 RepID=A0A5D2V4X9_GOSMU|nr:hypothetical protein E1A91_D05G356600v1 [Gossypium mustelinum]
MEKETQVQIPRVKLGTQELEVMNAGFENEFYLLKKLEREGKEEWLPIDSKPYCSSSGFDAISTLFQEIVSALNSLNVAIEQE